MIDLTIKTLDSQNHKFRVPDTFTILQLKEHIAEQVNVAVVQQRLIFCGRVLGNDTKLADIGIHGKVMHLVQKVPRLVTTTSGSSSSTTTNTNSRSGHNGGPNLRGWHAHDPTVVFGAIGIPSEFVHVGELPRVMSSRSQGIGNRVSMAMDMIRRSNEVLNRLENPSANHTSQSAVVDSEQEGSQQAEETSRNILPESVRPILSDPESVNVSYELDETFPNTVVVTIDATHHVRMPPGLMRHMQNHGQANNSSTNTNSATPNVENQTTPTTPARSNNQSAQQASSIPVPAAAQEQTSRDQGAEIRNATAQSDRRRFKELLEQLKTLNARLEPFYAMYSQYVSDDPQFESTEGENGSGRAQTVFNSVSEVMHYISHVYHAISDIKVAFNRSPPRMFQTRPCVIQGTIVQTAHTMPLGTSPNSVPVITNGIPVVSSGTPTVPSSTPSVPVSTTTVPPSTQQQTQQPTSTQTTNSNQSIPSVRAFRLDLANPGVNETSNNVPASTTTSESNTNVPVDSNTESNNTSTAFPLGPPHGVEFMFDLAPGTGTFRIDSVETSFVSPNVSGSSQPSSMSQSSNGSETSPNISMPMDWMDHMIDVISSGVRRPFISDPSLDWNSIPTTSTRTPRVTPRTTDSSSTTNSSSQGIPRSRDTGPRMDPFLPCPSHHFESHGRPMVVTRRSAQGADRSAASANSTTNTSTPTSPNEMRPFSGRRPGRPRPRYMQDPESFLAGIHPIFSWNRNQQRNSTTTSGSNNGQATGPGSNLTDTLAGQIRVGMESAFEALEREVNSNRNRDPNRQPSNNSASGMESPRVTFAPILRPAILLNSPINHIPYFNGLDGRSILVDLFLLVARDWTLFDILSMNTRESESSLVRYPVSRHSEALSNFILSRVMRNQPPSTINIEEAANRLYEELVPFIRVIEFSLEMRSNVNFGATILRYITLNLRGVVVYCEENRGGASNDIVTTLSVFAQGLFSLFVYCCNNRSIFRLNVAALLRVFPFPSNIQRVILDEAREHVDRYWDAINSYQMSITSVCNYIVPVRASGSQVGQTSRGNEEQSSNATLPSPELVNEPLPEVVIGSQEWHNGVASEWVPVIARDSQRQRRQGAQPPYSDAYLSGMPSKRRKIVTNSKPQGPLSKIIEKNLEVAMGAAGVTVKKEVTASVGADTAVQNAYTERIRTFGRSGLDTHPDFCPERYPNASKFFYDHNRPN